MYTTQIESNPTSIILTISKKKVLERSNTTYTNHFLFQNIDFANAHPTVCLMDQNPESIGLTKNFKFFCFFYLFICFYYWADNT